jgi:hypothetical protein
MYRKSSTQSKLDTIWNWENQKYIPKQKFQFLDVDGEIIIEFNRVSLSTNTNFEGTISLEAERSGGSGTSKIEVNPYSEIGQQRKPIGIKSDPPAVISKKLLNILIELEDAYSYSDRCYWSRVYPESATCRESFNTSIREIDSILKGNDVKKKLNYLKEKAAISISNYNSAVYQNNEYKLNFPFAEIANEDQFKIMFQSLRDSLEKSETKLRYYFEGNYWDALDYESQKTELIMDYLNSFESAGQDATNTFLSLVNKDPIQYKSIKNRLLSQSNDLKKIKIPNYKANDESMDSLLLKNYELIYECSSNLSELSRFKGSTLDKIINHFANKNGLIINNMKSSTGEVFTTQREKEKEFYKELYEAAIENISDSLSQVAGRLIYKKLIYATIDLGKSGSKSGEVLNIYVTWILDSKKDSLSNSPRLPIGKYYLRETGWKLEVTDMFSLVKRIHEPNGDALDVSPSNFKGSGGAVLLWTYNREDKGNYKTKNTSGTVVKRKKWFGNSANFLEPSVGLNVSYLDFSTTKDVEIGTGLQVGIFHNKIFFGYGVNLHMLSPKQYPFYYFIGFSFAKLSDFFTSTKNVNAVQ